MNKTIADITNCTGCGACQNICSHKAISMQVNDEGFLYPVVDNKKCINCGLCLKKCPSKNPEYSNFGKPDCLAISANDELRRHSSSGGVFPLLAEYVLEQGGYICGAAWNQDNLVEHIIISKKDDLYKLKGSKYLQSDVKDVYCQIKKILKQEKLVLFSGTPCQVAGLNAYLGKEHNKLITIDIVCHGTPSPKVYKKYIQELITDKNEKVIETNFRDKINGWTPYLTTTTITTTTCYSCPAEQDSFMTAFLRNLCLRDSCSKCPFAKLPRQGDITLGDFWGINKYSKKLDDKKGLSLVLANSPKGKKYIKLIKEQTKLYHNVPIKYAIKGNPCLVRSSIPHRDRKGFFERLDKIPLRDNVDIILGNKYDCGILNFWFGSNFGALLTCYALQETIKSFGKSPRVINYIPPQYLRNFEKSKSANFANKYLNLTQLCLNKTDLRELNNCTDAFIIGSDQVWRYPYFWQLGANIFQLNFVSNNKKKIAYAASFGTDHFEGNYEDTQLTKYYIQQFDNISVREDDGVDICNNTFGVEATHVLDPVFLTDMKAWDSIINNSSCNEKDFIASYVLDKGLTACNILNYVKEQFSSVKSNDMGDGIQEEKKSVEDWLYNVKNCKFFITDSFHGACFAIIFNKPFICIANKERGYSRFRSLFNVFGLMDRCVDTDDVDIKKIISKQIDWNLVNQIINKEAVRSRDWLVDALNTPVKNKDPMFEMLETFIIQQEKILNKQIRLPEIKKKYIQYKILSKICFGKKRKKYKQKYKELKKEKDNYSRY